MDIIIIGAGAAGLMAARELSPFFNVTILEAQGVIGGRIHTIRPSIEAGAEFIHGRLPVTIDLLKEAGLSYTAVDGEMYTAEDGEWKQEERSIEGWDELLDKMGTLTKDMTLMEFLETYYAEHKYADLRNEMIRYVQGYDLADPSKVSMFSLYNEWSAENDVNFRVDKGYCEMINFLAKGCTIITNNPVQKITWEQGNVKVSTPDKTYTAQKVIITASLGILQHNIIQFSPAIDDYMNAASHIGYGSVIKILLEFAAPFWQEDTGFIFSKEKVPVWWTQFPNKTPVLTGWLGGPPAEHFKQVSKEEILKIALQSLSNLTQKELPALVSSHIYNWADNPQTLGAYSYDTPMSDNARKLLNTPVADTIYFAGEALYEGKHPGTVEAALISGKNVAQMIKD
ncbi:Monoamine oxidase [Chitinophaga sp. YR573]|uniref:flavin monoamine oxidase family protein n=1 Tax=Chitinophaga sp. YR573 TaxID=1881040 RepID=UPI0008B6A014|nr:NAD(P)/FAD-dependent oxidoreductase [Chitinophaga sp. YR573]SEW34927.1 Monoamine oxidase [Chitinophaga sp. YR573]